jgi:hypothetical protein
MGLAGLKKPGEYPSRWLNRSPFDTPRESEYEAPSEKPANASCVGSIRQRSNVWSKARSRKSTSTPKSPSTASHVPERESGARRMKPLSSERS